MRRMIGLLGLAAVPWCAAPGQRPDTLPQPRDTVLDRRLLPAEVEREVTDIFNASGTLRSTGRLDIAADRVVDGDVAVLNGPLEISGRVSGRVVAINSDVVLHAGARVDGGILVVGGLVTGASEAAIAGDVRVYRQALTYRRDGERLIAQSSSDEDERWWRRRQRWHAHGYSDLRLVSARTYNRVEGLPIYFGPTAGRDFGGGTRLQVDAYGIFRTSERLVWNGENVGHNLKAELRIGRDRGFAVGGRLFDIVDPVESWQLSDTEVGLASFFLHRDFRDYFGRHGGTGYATLMLGGGADITASLSDQTWQSRLTRDPFTLFRNDQGWRINPAMDEGHLHIGTLGFRFDTRNDEDSPWSGWYIMGEAERGSGQLDVIAPTSLGVRDVVPGPVNYTRATLDVRRYNRISPDGQVNVRLFAGGWMSGDELPLQRRFSLGGAGTLPGFDFRRGDFGGDLLTCSASPAAPGTPAQCERVLLAQVEYRGDLRIDFFDDLDGWSHEGWEHGAQWVVFADAGRGWLVGPRSGDLQYEQGDLPGLSTFRTDIGAGLDFGTVGIFLAKATSESKAPPNLFVRIRRRF